MDTVAVLDFGGQYAHLIANRIRRLGVFSEIVDYSVSPAQAASYKGLVLSGGPHSVLNDGSPQCDRALFDLDIPVLGLCYGHQLMSVLLGGEVSRGKNREFGRAQLTIVREDTVFAGLSGQEQIWMSHGDAVSCLPDGFEVLASTQDCFTAAVRHREKPLFGFQFHPEVTDTTGGMTMLGNFLTICGCRREWNPRRFTEEIQARMRSACEGKKVFLLVSGGVDSTVAFALLNNVLGPERVLGLHVDNGLMRLDESAGIMEYLRAHGFDNLRIVDASRNFLAALTGLADPEQKREVIGRTFIEVQQQELSSLGLNDREWLLGQGTIYPDTIESAGTSLADRIKTHHNRVDVVLELIRKGLVVEPLSLLYKDEVRELGEALGLPHSLVWRHPFPGPGLGVRVLCSHGGDEPVDAGVGEAVRDIAAAAGFTGSVLPVRSVGVQGDGRTYAHPVLLTGPRDWDALERLSTVLTNTVTGVNRIVYGLRLRGKPHYRVVRGYVTQNRLDVLRRFDALMTALVRTHGCYDAIWQMPVVLLPLTNEEGNESLVLRPIVSREAMTARFFPLSDAVIDAMLVQAKGCVGVGDIFIDVTHKPPATIEWE